MVINEATLPLRDRIQAGRALGAALAAYRGRNDVLVLALPRGGVPVACEVADLLGACVDLMIVRKLGTPGQEELAMGAIDCAPMLPDGEPGLVDLDQRAHTARNHPLIERSAAALFEKA